jgi:hypothetical protein
VIEPPQVRNPAPIWWIWAGQQCAPIPLEKRTATPKPGEQTGGEAHGECLRRTRSEAAGEELGADPIDRCMVNTGTVPASPSPPPGQGGGGQARCRLMSPGRGGGSVVVRGRESRSHGEGTQRVCREDLECQEDAGEY